MRISFDFFLSNAEGTTKLIYAFHTGDPNSEDDIPMHDINSMGVRSVFLLNTFENVPELPVDAESFDFKMNKVIIVFVVKEN